MSKVKWNAPVPVRGMSGENIRYSKDGRFSIERRRMASARNGYWTAVEYTLTDKTTGRERRADYLWLAKEFAQDWADETQHKVSVPQNQK